MKLIGRIKYTIRGVYDPGVTYTPMNVVLYGGSSWACIKETTGNMPPDHQFNEDGTAASNEYWELFLPGAAGDDFVKKTDIAKAPTDTTPGIAGIVYPDGDTITADENGMLKGTPSGKVMSKDDMDEKLAAGELKNGEVIYAYGQAAGENGILIKIDKALNEQSENAIANKAVTIAINKANDFSDILAQIANGTYDGRNLADVYDGEIASYSSPWEWIKARITDANFKGLFPADYIPITMTDGEVVVPQIAGINTYKGTTDLNLGNHIDFISKDCLSQAVKWNLTDNNNGNATNGCAYMISNVREHLLNIVYPKLPLDVKNVINDKRALVEYRYSDSGVLADSNGWSWNNIGYLWIPSEYEIIGNAIFGTRQYASGQAAQYPLFYNGYKHRGKMDGKNVSTSWHTTTLASQSYKIVGVSNAGIIATYNATQLFGVPLCFRISEQ